MSQRPSKFEIGVAIVLGATFVVLFGLLVLSAAERRRAIDSLPPIACAEGQDCSSKNYKAQARAAHAAEDTANLAFLQIPLGLAGLYYIARTLSATRAAVREASEATDTARHALEVTEATARTQLRPYVFQDMLTWIWLHDGQQRDRVTHWQFSIVWKNMGQTPAVRVVSRASFQFFPASSVPADFAFPDREYENDVVGTVGPAQVFNNTLPFSVADLLAVGRREKALAIWAWAEYDGLEPGKRHRTEWQGWLQPMDDPSLTSTGFVFAIGDRRFNCVDEACFHKPKTA